MDHDTPTPDRRAAAPGALLVLASTLTAIILFQATLAGRFLFEAGDIAFHGYLGNGSFVLGLAIAAVAVFGRVPRPALMVSLALLVALFTQIGLGYAGRETAAAAAWHIPMGVTCLGLAAALITLAAVLRTTSMPPTARPTTAPTP